MGIMKTGSMGMGSGSRRAAGEELVPHKEELEAGSIAARRRVLAGARRVWGREDGFTLARQKGI